MINRTIEKIIFIIILVIIFVVTTIIITHIKIEEAPVNGNLSPDEVIQKELPVYADDTQLDYSYEIIGDTIFVLVDSATGVSQLYTGSRNPNSGFMFEQLNTIFFIKPDLLMYIRVDGESSLALKISHEISDYVIEIKVLDDFSILSNDDSDVCFIDQDGRSLDKLKHEGVRGTFWVDVLENITEDYKIIAEYKDRSITLVDSKAIQDFFGGKE